MSRVLGRALTQATGPPTAATERIEAARALRRALADAGRKAFEVERVLLVASAPIDEHALRLFARRALGPHGDQVHVVSLTAGASELMSERSLTDLAATVPPAGRTAPARVTLVVGFGDDGTMLALCLGMTGPCSHELRPQT